MSFFNSFFIALILVIVFGAISEVIIVLLGGNGYFIAAAFVSLLPLAIIVHMLRLLNAILIETRKK